MDGRNRTTHLCLFTSKVQWLQSSQKDSSVRVPVGVVAPLPCTELCTCHGHENRGNPHLLDRHQDDEDGEWEVSSRN